MSSYAVSQPTPLLPDPDENSPPEIMLDSGDVLKLEQPLGTWSQVSVVRPDKKYTGWITLAKLSEANDVTIKLLDEPFGQIVATATGQVNIITTVADWVKIKVTSSDGKVFVGWAQGVSHPQEPVGQPESVDLVLGVNEKYRRDLVEAEQRTGITLLQARRGGDRRLKEILKAPAYSGMAHKLIARGSGSP
jgi:hypothetical protein